jgi:hypothetical protein
MRDGLPDIAFSHSENVRRQGQPRLGVVVNGILGEPLQCMQ